MSAGWIEPGDIVLVRGYGRAIVEARAGICQSCPPGDARAWRIQIGGDEAIACEGMLTPLQPGRRLACHHTKAGHA